MTGDAPGTLAEACQLSRLSDSVSDLPTFAFAGSTLFGGQAMAFAVAAAARSAPPVRRPISVHATFPRGGRAGDNVSLEVTAVRDGSTLSHRAVVVYQHGQPLLQVSVLLAKEPADGTAGNLDGSAATMMAQLPPRASTDSYSTVFERAWSFPFLEFRRCVTPCGRTGLHGLLHPVWLHCRAPWPDGTSSWPAHAFISDLTVVTAALNPAERKTHRAVSVEHLLRPERVLQPDRWHLLDTRRRFRRDAYALVEFALYDEDGRIITSGDQLVQVLPPSAASVGA